MKKYDLHTHLFTTWEKGRFSLERASRDPDSLVDSIRQSGLDGIALVNFTDTRYEQFAVSARQNRGRYRLAKELENALVFDAGDKEIAVIKGQEIPTDRGHLLVLGLPGELNIPKNYLNKVIWAAQARGAPVIPDHWWAKMGIGKQRVIKNAGEYAAFEQGNGNFDDPSESDVDEIIRETGLFGIRTSDSHNRKDLGNGYIEVVVGGFDFSSGDCLNESIRDVLKKGRFKVGKVRKNPIGSRLGHMALVGYDVYVRRPLGTL